MDIKIELLIPNRNVQEQEIIIKIDMSNYQIQYINGQTSLPLANSEKQISFQDFIYKIIKEKKSNGNLRTAEAYQSALNSFNRFIQDRPMPLNEIDCIVMEDYEAYLKKTSVCMNTVSFYMRIIKAVYKRAVSLKMITDNSPFKNVYTGVAKTRKRALDVNTIRQIKSLSLIDDEERLARDLFLFSFYTRGMSFVDMAFLQKKDVNNGLLTYKRRKTGQLITVKWESAMQEIVDNLHSYNDTYLLPIIKRVGRNERSQYKYMQYMVNKSLNTVGKRLMLPCVLTMYVARHSWASIAKSADVPLSIISEAMGHSSEKMTRIYLKSMDEWKIHYENERVIHLVQ